MTNFYLSNRAFQNLQVIYDYTLKNWGKAKADEYISSFYNDFQKIANNISLGNIRKNRSDPFLMYPSGKYYILYEPYKSGIIIITILHQVRNIESLIKEFISTFYSEIVLLKAEIND